MSDELLPCPFCGSQASIDSDYSHFWIDCHGCYTISRTCDSRASAIAAWNRRIPAPLETTDLVRRAQLQNED